MLKTCFIFIMLSPALLAHSQSDSTGNEPRKRKLFIPKYERTKGYVGWVEAGVDYMPVKWRNLPYVTLPAPAVIVFNGARLNRNITLGLEVGLFGTSHISVNPKVRYNLYLKPRIALMFDFAAGYSYTILNIVHENGFNFSPSAGFKIWGKKGKAAFTFRVGYTGIYSRTFQDKQYPAPPQYLGIWSYYSGIYGAIGVEF